MDSKELRSLMEAYQQVYAPQEVKEKLRKEEYLDETGKRDQGIRDRIKMFKKGNIEHTPPRNWDPDANRGKGATVSPKQAEKRRRKALRQEELDLFDTVLEYLQSEGIVESVEDAEWMMVNVLDEEDVDSIIDEARRADKEGYARGSKENPKRKDIPHGDVSQRSMLHSKLKRRADEMGRARRSSARNKAGGRTPVGKKEKAFLQAVTRTAGQVRQPNVPDTGKHKK